MLLPLTNSITTNNNVSTLKGSAKTYALINIMVSRGGRGGRSSSSSYNSYHHQNDNEEEMKEEVEEENEENEEQELGRLVHPVQQQPTQLRLPLNTTPVIEASRIREARYLSQEALRIATEAQVAAARLQDYRSKTNSTSTSTSTIDIAVLPYCDVPSMPSLKREERGLIEDRVLASREGL